jgi:signal transduction histidine kinase
MVNLLRHPTTLLLNYCILILFGLAALGSLPAFSAAWWTVTGLMAPYLVMVFFWPTRKWAIYAYLATETVLILALTALFRDFMFLGFMLSAHAAGMLPLNPAFAVLGAYSLGLEAVLIYQFGWWEGLYPGLAPIVGFFSFGYAYNMRERADEARVKADEARQNAEIAREKAQALLEELRAANRKLEAYAVQVHELAAMEERNRLARELHDSVKQQAFAVSGQLGAAHSLLTGNPSAAGDHLRKAEALMDEIRQELSQLIHELRPVALQGKGLAAALREWGATWSSGCDIPLDVYVQGERSLPLETEQALFRIAQEALSNVARHSGASRVEIRLEYGANTLHLSICDNGQGFDPHQPANGIGLRTMRERAERLNAGTLTIDSAPGQPTRVTVTCAI